MGVWKDAKSKNSIHSTDKIDNQRGETEIYTSMKDKAVTFPESPGHHIPLESSPSWPIGPPTNSEETAVLDFQNAETAKSQVKDSLKKYSTILFALGASAAFLSVIDSQITRKVRENNTTSLSTSNTLDIYIGIQVSARSAISILSVTTAIYLYIYYSQIHTLRIIRNHIPPESGFWLSNLALLFSIELIVCLMHIPPGINFFPEEAQLIVFSRFYLIVRFLKQKNKLKNSKATRFLASVTKTELGSVFLLKMYFLKNPFMLVIGTYMITVLFGGYAVYVVEKKISFMDTIWMLIVTMTTVGFGDFVPRSVMARAFTAATAIIGVFLMALCISLVHESLQLTQQEKRILACLETSEHYRQVKETAARAIQYWWKYSRLSRKGRRRRSSAYHIIKTTKMKTKLYESILKWRTVQGEKKDDYWRKEFLGDNTAMLLTDVSREVKSIKELLEDFVQPALDPLENVAALQTGNEASPQEDPHILPQLATGREEVPVRAQNHSTPPETHQHLTPESSRDTLQHFNETDSHLQHNRYQHRASISSSSSGVGSFRGYSMSASPDNNTKEIRSPWMVLQNQIRVMNNNLDEIYAKSKQELKDLENLVSCAVHVHRNPLFEIPLCPNCRIISQLRASSS